VTRAMTPQSAPLSAEVAQYLADCVAYACPDQAGQIRAASGAAAVRSRGGSAGGISAGTERR